MHPLVRALLATVRAHGLVGRGDTVLVACSGGPDSLALLDALAGLRRLLGCVIQAAYVDHGLRPEAPAEGRRVERAAAARDVPARVVQLELRRGANLQARARAARHAALEALREELGATSIALAHTATDQAETVLMRLLDGAGARGLGAMAPRSGRLVRPLLEVTRAEVEAYVRARRLRPVRDPSNRDPAFERVRVRTDVLPALRRAWPEAERALARSAANLRDDLEVLAWAEAEALRRAGVELGAGRAVVELGTWDDLPRPLRAHALQQLAARLGAPLPGRRHLLALVDLCATREGTARLALPGLAAERAYGRLTLERPRPAPAPPAPVRVRGHTILQLGPFELELTVAEGREVVVRPARAGDRVGREKVARRYIDAKIARSERAFRPVIADPADDRVLCVPGLTAAPVEIVRVIRLTLRSPVQ